MTADRDNDWNDRFDADRQSDELTEPCPYCGRDIFEDSPRCPHCGHYISDEDAPPRPKPWWVIIGVLLCLLGVWLWLTMFP